MRYTVIFKNSAIPALNSALGRDEVNKPDRILTNVLAHIWAGNVLKQSALNADRSPLDMIQKVRLDLGTGDETRLDIILAGYAEKQLDKYKEDRAYSLNDSPVHLATVFEEALLTRANLPHSGFPDIEVERLGQPKFNWEF